MFYHAAKAGKLISRLVAQVSLRPHAISFMLPTDGKATNGFRNKIRWPFFNPLGNFLI